jgi:hypothetical protein
MLGTLLRHFPQDHTHTTYSALHLQIVSRIDTEMLKKGRVRVAMSSVAQISLPTPSSCDTRVRAVGDTDNGISCVECKQKASIFSQVDEIVHIPLCPYSIDDFMNTD